MSLPHLHLTFSIFPLCPFKDDGKAYLLVIDEDYSRTVTDIELYAIAKVLKTKIDDLIDPSIITTD